MKKTLIHIGKDIIDAAQNEYKNNYNIYFDFNEFIQACPTIKTLIVNNQLLYKMIEKQFYQKNALQPSIIGEIVSLNELSKFLKMTELEVNFNKNNGKHRARFYNNKNQLVYYGDPSHKDIDLIINNKYVYHIEIKSYKSRSGDFDLSPYNINGEVKPQEKENIFNTDAGLIILNAFNKWNYGFANMGKNYKFDNDSNICENFSKMYFTGINYCIIIYPRKIVLYTVDNHFYSLINYTGSEIRTTGKNSRKLCTLENKLDEWVIENKIIQNNNIYQVPENKLNLIYGRGTNKLTRYGILKHYVFIRIEDCEVKNGIVYFSKNKVKQTTPNGSVHITFKEEED